MLTHLFRLKRHPSHSTVLGVSLPVLGRKICLFGSSRQNWKFVARLGKV